MIGVEEARAYYHDADSAHGFEHVLRVWRLAERIGREEGADLDVLQAAALLHDVARPDEARTGVSHAEGSARRAREILTALAPAADTAYLARVERAAEAIAQHRFRTGERPTSLEARVLYDADKLDAIGAIGVARAYAVAGAQRQRLWADLSPDAPGQATLGDLADADHTPVHEYVFKLRRLAGGMFTPTGRRLAEGRHRAMTAFYEQLAREVRGEA